MALDDLLAELMQRMRDVAGVRDGLWRLIEAVVSVASAEFNLSSVLDRVVEVAREMVDAEYAALGVIACDGTLQEFVHTGMEVATVESIGNLPRGHGILGLLITEPQVLRLDDLSDHPAAVGFPEHHPPMRSFLGVPIVIRDAVYGNLYLTNRRGGHGFTDDDIELVTTLAAVAGAVIDNARLHDLALGRQGWLEATRDLTAQLLGGATAADVHALMVTRARELASATTCTLALADGATFEIAAAAGRASDALLGERFAREGSISQDALDRGSAVVFDDIATLDVLTQPLTALGIYGPMLVTPLCVQGRGLGTLAVAREKGELPFTEDDRDAAESFGAQVALALDYDHAQAERRRSAVFDDRERIGHDLHDLVIQRLFATGLDLDAVAAQIPDAAAADRIIAGVDQIDAAISDLRSSIFALHARRQGAASLPRQLDELVRNAETALGFAPECTIDPGVDRAVSDELVPDLLAVVREALTNVGRHAQARRACIDLRVVGATVHLDIVDDGDGMGATGRRSGLANLAARAKRLGGSMDIGTPDGGGGTRLQWRAPLQ